MNTAAMKRFAAGARERLVGEVGERSAYVWFMRLCAAYAAEPERLRGIMSLSADRREAEFASLCEELRDSLGGIFAIYGDIQTFPDVILADGGTAHELLRLSEDELPRAPESLCWLHQDFDAPVREAAINALKRREKLKPDDVAVSTQIFTPGWIVRYMVQGTLVRHWYEHGGAELPWEHSEYVCGKLQRGAGDISPEEITFLDPCCGCGSILLYAFDALLDMYRASGFSDNIAAKMILSRNLFGLELDERACAVTVTALRLKSRKFGVKAVPQVYSFAGMDGVGSVGSLADADMLRGDVRRVLSMSFDVVATNPPYLALSCMDRELSAFVSSRYHEYRADLFAVFMVRCIALTKPGGRLGFLTPYVWLFIRSFEALRRLIYRCAPVESLIQLEYSAFEDATVPVCTFTLRCGASERSGIYVRLTGFKGGLGVQEKMYLAALRDTACGYVYTASAADFLRIPCAPAAYWISPAALGLFGGRTVGDFAPVRQGMITGDNDRFLRLWFEVGVGNIAFSHEIGKKWYLLNKGGSYRKWFGNREYVVNWQDDGAAIRAFTNDSGKPRSRPQNLEFSFKPSVSWTLVTSGDISVRLYDGNFMFNVAGSCAFPESGAGLMFLLAMLNSSSAAYLMSVVNPTMNLNVGDTARLPLPDVPEDDESRLMELARENTELCRDDWDAFEVSWNFKKHPLV
ncbi:MAG: N-6 DNA methylase [Ruminococcus sp.]|nr:N-6 DNA methylase [Ruminococcus sp.]